jgi:hypothetical protein
MADSAPVRSDPVPRRTDGQTGWDKILNKDPDKWYVLVPLLGVEYGPDLYESMGYRIEKWDGTETGTNLQGGKHSRKKGDALQTRGVVVMSCSMERHNELVAHGDDGESGQEMADILEKQIMSTRIGSEEALSPELSKGISRKYVHFFHPKNQD